MKYNEPLDFPRNYRRFGMRYNEPLDVLRNSYEGTFSTVQSLLSSDSVHKVGLSEV